MYLEVKCYVGYYAPRRTIMDPKKERKISLCLRFSLRVDALITRTTPSIVSGPPIFHSYFRFSFSICEGFSRSLRYAAADSFYVLLLLSVNNRPKRIPQCTSHTLCTHDVDTLKCLLLSEIQSHVMAAYCLLNHSVIPVSGRAWSNIMIL